MVTAIRASRWLLPCLLVAQAVAATWSGSVREAVVEEGVLVERPLAGATVAIGVELRLRTGPDGRDELLAGGDDAGIAVGTTDVEGGFEIAVRGAEPTADVLVWRPGSLPVLRASVRPGAELRFTLTRADEGSGHTSLLLPSGALVLPASVEAGVLPFVDASIGLLWVPPSGFTLAPGRGALTLARFARGEAEVRLVRSPGPLTADELDRALRDSVGEPGAARLLSSRRIEIDRRWRHLAEYRDGGRDVCAVYLERAGVGLALVLSAPREDYADLAVTFVDSMESLRLRGAPRAIAREGRVRSDTLGISLLSPPGWSRQDSPDGALSLLGEGCVHIREAAPEAGALGTLLDGELAGWTLREARETWELVAGCPARVREGVAEATGGGSPSYIRALAVWRGADAIVVRLEAPEGVGSAPPALLDELQDSLRFAPRASPRD